MNIWSDRPRRIKSDRRASSRVAEYRTVRWRADSAEEIKPGWIVGESDRGLAMVTESSDTPAVGTFISSRSKRGPSGWSKPVRVIRTESLSGILDLVAAEYVDK